MADARRAILPNGQTLTFPANATDAEMTEAVNRYVASQRPASAQELAGRVAGTVGDIARETSSGRVTLPQALEQRFGPTVGPVVGAVAPLVGPVAGMTVGAARGAAMGSALGPFGTFAGGLLGAAAGGGAGQLPNELITAAEQGRDYSPVEGLQRVGGQALAGAEAQAPFGLAGLALPAIGAGIKSYFQIATPAARQATAAAARAHGIDLTAAQESGNPFLKAVQAMAIRLPKGQEMLEPFGQAQTSQILTAGEKLGENVSGLPMMDQALRDNRFLNVLKARVADLKAEEGTLFDAYYRASGGANAIVADRTLAPLRDAAAEIRSSLPIISGLKPSKLEGILREIEALGKPKIDPRVERGLRTQLGLGPDEAIPAWAMTPDMMKSQDITLGQLRHIKEALGEIANFDNLGNAVASDIPTRTARRLYGATMEALKTDADTRGVRPLYDAANQFTQVSIHGPLDTTMYAKILEGEKDFGSVSRALFNRMDPGVLRDARAVVSDEGWQLIQQQYWDDVFNTTIANSKGAGGIQGFRGREFANRLQKDGRVLDVLFSPEQAKAIKEFGDVTRTVQDTTAFYLSRDFTMAMMSYLSGIPPAYRLLTLSGDRGDVAQVALAATLPYVMGRILADPTATRIMTAAVRSGGPTEKTIAALGAVLKTGVRATASDLNQDDAQGSVSVPVPAGLQ